MKYLGIEIEMQKDGWEIVPETDKQYNTYNCVSHVYIKDENVVSIYLPCPRWQLFIESSKHPHKLHELPNSVEELNKIINEQKEMDSPGSKS